MKGLWTDIKNYNHFNKKIISSYDRFKTFNTNASLDEPNKKKIFSLNKEFRFNFRLNGSYPGFTGGFSGGRNFALKGQSLREAY